MLACLLKGDAKKYHTKLRAEVCKKFKVPLALKSKIPSHITLKYSFEANAKELKQLEKTIEEFTKRNCECNIVIGGFSHFLREVIFLKINETKEMRNVQKGLVSKLKELNWITWNEHDGKNMKFHATIARHDIGTKFDDIYSYVNDHERIFESKFNNIAIMKKNKETWKLYKEFKLKRPLSAAE